MQGRKFSLPLCLLASVALLLPSLQALAQPFAKLYVSVSNPAESAAPAGVSLLQSARVEGAVTDPAGAKVSAARVRLRDATGQTVAETESDAEGRFSFKDLKPGSYKIEVSAAGFSQPDTVSVTVKASGVETVNIKLAIAALSEQVNVAAQHPAYTALRGAKLSGEAATVNNLVLKRDTAQITFKQGQIFFVAPVEGKVTAAVFVGEGEFQMTPMLEVEVRNLSIYTGAAALTEQFNKLVLRFTDDTYEEIKKQAQVQSGAAVAGAQETLDNHRRLLRRGKIGLPGLANYFVRYNLDARILMDVLHAGKAGGLFNAYFDGKRYGDLIFSYDPLGLPFVSPEEVALVSLNEKTAGIWVAHHLTPHYQTTAFFDESHATLDFVHHKIDATMKGRRLEAVVRSEYKALADGARVLPFDLFARLRVSKITDDQNRPLRFIQENRDEDGDLYVLLAEPLKKGQGLALTFEYAGDNAVEDSGGGNFTLVTRTNWYPNTATFGEDRATFEMTLRTAKDLMMVATGKPLGETVENNMMVTRWKSDVPLAVAGFNYGKFKKSAVQDDKTKYAIEAYANRELPDYLRDIQREVEELQRAGYQVPVTLGSLNTTSMMDKARAEALVSMQIYTNMFGELPYGRLAISQQPAIGFGQAWPMLVYMPLMAFLDSTFRQQLGLGGSGASNFVKFVGPHEVAHQWWGHILGWKSYRDQWMSEGFSEFSASIFAQMVYKNEKFIEIWRDHREQILGKNTQGRRPADIGSVYMGYRLDTPRTGAVTRAVIYPKGAFILHMIRMLMWDRQSGDQRFSTMMKDFVKTHYNSNVSTADFQRIIEKHMTADMDLDGNGKMAWFFKQWVYGHQIPDYKLDYRFEAGEGGKTVLKFKVTQSGVDDNFKMRVPIYLDFDGRLTRLGTVAIVGNSSTQEYSVAMDQKPKRVAICSYEDVLCTTNDR